jgi:hypothetical protein
LLLLFRYFFKPRLFQSLLLLFGLFLFSHGFVPLSHGPFFVFLSRQCLRTRNALHDCILLDSRTG